MTLKNITFVHPTTGATLTAELMDSLTVNEVILALVQENFIDKPDNDHQYVFGIVGIGKLENNDTFIGVPDNSYVNIVCSDVAGGGPDEVEAKTESILSPVEFTVIVPEYVNYAETSIVNLLVYEDNCKDIVEKILADNAATKEIPIGRSQLSLYSKVSVVMSAEGIEIENNIKENCWGGGYLRFTFLIRVLEGYRKVNIPVSLDIYIDDVIAAQLDFLLPVDNEKAQTVPVNRKDIMSAFMSYASQDRNKVISIMQGMKKVRPEMDIFFDIDGLRSGENWQLSLQKEIDNRDYLFLCWSSYAKKSYWVDKEWRYAYQSKGDQAIEPIPLENPTLCPPPVELSHKHFNDKYIMFVSPNDQYKRLEEKLQRLKILYEKQLISSDEYQLYKTDVLQTLMNN